MPPPRPGFVPNALLFVMVAFNRNTSPLNRHLGLAAVCCLFPEIVLFSISKRPLWLRMPPPPIPPTCWLRLTVLSSILAVPKFRMPPPPKAPLRLRSMVLALINRLPELSIPPLPESSKTKTLSLILLSKMNKSPSLLMPPPLIAAFDLVMMVSRSTRRAPSPIAIAPPRVSSPLSSPLHAGSLRH
jgi:hypothetical protein